MSIETVARTGSTNADLLARCAAGETLPEGFWLVADRQHAGRGRQGRSWLDAPGNFMGSTVVCLGEHDLAPTTVSLVAAIAVYEAVLLRLAAPHLLTLKWPNDVLLGEAKLAGILLERDGAYMVVGIGVNLAGAPLLPDRAAGHLGEAGPAPGRNQFASDLAVSFSRELDRWRRAGAEAVIARWLAVAHPVGTQLSVHGADGAILHGAFAGLEADGALRLRLADGGERVIHAGDVTLEGNAA